jgi:F-type H+-transporting ATPase subunit b
LFTFEPGVALWTIIAFCIVLFIMRKYVYPPVNQLLTLRKETIAKNLTEAEQKNAVAEKVSKELSEKLQTIRMEEQRVLSEAREQARQLYEKYAAEAMTEIRDMRKQKETDLGQMESAFFEKSEQKLTRLIVTSCEKILKTGLTVEQQQAIITERIADLEKVQNL